MEQNFDKEKFCKELVAVLRELRESDNSFKTSEILEKASETLGFDVLYVLAEVQNNWRNW